jgi:hypothetical protein
MTGAHTVRLLASDAHHLVCVFPYLAFSKLNSAKRLVDRWLCDVSELEAVFLQYPAVKYEPLDSLYIVLKCLGALSPPLVEELCCGRHDWKGVVTAAGLVAMLPEPQYRESIAGAEVGPLNQWLVELALCEIDGALWQRDPDLQATLRALRAWIVRVPRPQLEVRRDTRAVGSDQYAEARLAVAVAYERGGVQAARAVLQQFPFLLEPGGGGRQ